MNATPQGIDRDALEAVVRAFVAQGADYDEDDVMVASVVTEILALLRPVEGITPPQDVDGDAVLDAIRSCAAYNMELRPDGSEDPYAAAYVEGVHAAYDAAEQALVRPVEGIVLSREDRRRIVAALQCVADLAEDESRGLPAVLRRMGDAEQIVPLRALAARLEAAQ